MLNYNNNKENRESLLSETFLLETDSKSADDTSQLSRPSEPLYDALWIPKFWKCVRW